MVLALVVGRLVGHLVSTTGRYFSRSRCFGECHIYHVCRIHLSCLRFLSEQDMIFFDQVICVLSRERGISILQTRCFVSVDHSLWVYLTGPCLARLGRLIWAACLW